MLNAITTIVLIINEKLHLIVLVDVVQRFKILFFDNPDETEYFLPKN